jgi:hypothetical protein
MAASSDTSRLVAAALACLAAAGLAACDPPPAERAPCPECAERPPAPPAEVGGTRVEHWCDADDYRIAVAVSVDVESIALGAGGRGTGTFRRLHRVTCSHCIGEEFSHRSGGEDACEEGSWECTHVAVDLGGVDDGQPLAHAHVVPSDAHVLDDADEIVRDVDRLLVHLDDPERYEYLDKNAARALARRAQQALASLRGPDTIYLRIPGGVLAVRHGEATIVTAGTALSLGTADCHGVHPGPQ